MIKFFELLGEALPHKIVNVYFEDGIIIRHNLIEAVDN